MIINHLKYQHGILYTSPREERKARVQSSIEQAIENAKQSAGFKRRRITALNSDDDFNTPHIVDPYIMELLYTRWIARCHLPLKMIECDEFRALFTYINKDAASYLPSNSRTVKDWIARTYLVQQERQINLLHKARSKIHL